MSSSGAIVMPSKSIVTDKKDDTLTTHSPLPLLVKIKDNSSETDSNVVPVTIFESNQSNDDINYEKIIDFFSNFSIIINNNTFENNDKLLSFFANDCLETLFNTVFKFLELKKNSFDKFRFFINLINAYITDLYKFDLSDNKYENKNVHIYPYSISKDISMILPDNYSKYKIFYVNFQILNNILLFNKNNKMLFNKIFNKICDIKIIGNYMFFIYIEYQYIFNILNYKYSTYKINLYQDIIEKKYINYINNLFISTNFDNGDSFNFFVFDNENNVNIISNKDIRNDKEIDNKIIKKIKFLKDSTFNNGNIFVLDSIKQYNKIN